VSRELLTPHTGTHVIINVRSLRVVDDDGRDDEKSNVYGQC
jgi:hypothetical protein